MKCSLGISNFLQRPLVFPILLFSFISLHWSLWKAFLPLLAILWNFAFRGVYLSFSPLPLASLLFRAICKASSDNYFAFFNLFLGGMVLITTSRTMLGASVHSSSVPLSDLTPWIWFRSYLNRLALFPWFSSSSFFPSFCILQQALLFCA